MVDFKDRVKELRRVPASELRINPKNWRKHPPSQSAALRGVLTEIGFADAMIARETTNGLELIDGHLRQEIMGNQLVPVLVLDVNEQEADKMLATLDPIAAMAHADQDQLLALLEGTSFADQAINDMLEALANGERLPMPDLTAEWEGMPEFEQNDITSWRRIIVHFANQADIDAFAIAINQTLTDKTRSVWFPPVAKEPFMDRRYIADES